MGAAWNFLAIDSLFFYQSVVLTTLVIALIQIICAFVSIRIFIRQPDTKSVINLSYLGLLISLSIGLIIWALFLIMSLSA
jgi:hypothetical protein